MTALHDVGAVAIGRNEGANLERCLRSLVGRVARVVYVDSGSTDGSVELARGLGVEVVALDLSTPFTAARARNAGWRKLIEIAPGVAFVQFVDGDCEVVDGWVETARGFLGDREDVAVVCGRRRERFPERSVYNKLCDLEWDTPVGEARACGGDALFRRDALERAGGYDDSLIAGEEPELCFRIRQAGGKVWRLGREMTLHDANMTRFGQWWRRHVRAGHAYAEVSALHAGESPEQMWRRNVRSNVAWTALFPLWPLLWAKVWAQGRGAAYATSIVLSKPAQAVGHATYWRNARAGRRSGLIEYKGAGAT